jgi:hypothetical protein
MAIAAKKVVAADCPYICMLIAPLPAMYNILGKSTGAALVQR